MTGKKVVHQQKLEMDSPRIHVTVLNTQKPVCNKWKNNCNISGILHKHVQKYIYLTPDTFLLKYYRHLSCKLTSSRNIWTCPYIRNPWPYIWNCILDPMFETASLNLCLKRHSWPYVWNGILDLIFETVSLTLYLERHPWPYIWKTSLTLYLKRHPWPYIWNGILDPIFETASLTLYLERHSWHYICNGILDLMFETASLTLCLQRHP